MAVFTRNAICPSRIRRTFIARSFCRFASSAYRHLSCWCNGRVVMKSRRSPSEHFSSPRLCRPNRPSLRFAPSRARRAHSASRLSVASARKRFCSRRVRSRPWRCPHWRSYCQIRHCLLGRRHCRMHRQCARCEGDPSAGSVPAADLLRETPACGRHEEPALARLASPLWTEGRSVRMVA
jgi:hypothetical protein